MNKKGQVYIIAVIILSLIFYGLSYTPNIAVQQEFKGDFEKLCQNYEVESSKLINSLLLSKKDIIESFTNFTVMFMSYSKSQNPNFGLITSLSYEGNTRICNYLKKPIVIDDGTDLHYLDGCFGEIPASMVFQGLVINVPATQIGDIQNCFVDIPFKKKVGIGFLEKKEPLEIVWYPFEIKANRPQLWMVNMQEEASQKRVHIAGEGYVIREEYKVKESKIKTVLED